MAGTERPTPAEAIAWAEDVEEIEEGDADSYLSITDMRPYLSVLLDLARDGERLRAERAALRKDMGRTRRHIKEAAKYVEGMTTGNLPHRIGMANRLLRVAMESAEEAYRLTAEEVSE